MNVEIGAEAALFPEKEYINGIAIAVCVFFSLHSTIFIESYLAKKVVKQFQYLLVEFHTMQPEINFFASIKNN
jgi:hypothetical protein